MKIFKYAIPVDDDFTIAIPEGGKVLCVQPQVERVCIWVLVDPEKEPTFRRFRLVGTGHDIRAVDPSYGPSPDNCGRYVGTFQVHGGALVFHLFEVQ